MKNHNTLFAIMIAGDQGIEFQRESGKVCLYDSRDARKEKEKLKAEYPKAKVMFVPYVQQ